jgi:integrase
VSVISPTESFLVKNILGGAKRRLAVPTKKKEPITPELLLKMYDNLYGDNNVFNQRTICACLLGYAAFLRVSELLNLRRCDIEFFPSHHVCIHPEK